MNKTERVLTGITTTGTPHLGNYVGSIRPAVRASMQDNVQSFYFLADYHGLIKCDDPARITKSTLEIAASWLAAGLDPERVTMYRQSDVPEIPELCWLLTCVTAKGLLNRAHAYKAAVDKNEAAGVETDDGVTAGLFMYPVLMAADILLFSANKVPVGRDQIQHIEMCRDIALRFNHLYANDESLLTPPQALIDDNVALLAGLDGRKMSKSYNNTIALFSTEKELRAQIMSIKTDSRAPNEPKDSENSTLFSIYRAFADDNEVAALKEKFDNGIAWGDVKQILFEKINTEISPMRDKYNHLIANPAIVEEILQKGAIKARAIATPFIQKLRHAVGIRKLNNNLDNTKNAKIEKSKKSPAILKQYKEKDGLFYFKLSTPSGEVVLQSVSFTSPRDAGILIAALQQEAAAALSGKENLINWDQSMQRELAFEILEQFSSHFLEEMRTKDLKNN